MQALTLLLLQMCNTPRPRCYTVDKRLVWTYTRVIVIEKERTMLKLIGAGVLLYVLFATGLAQIVLLGAANILLVGAAL